METNKNLTPEDHDNVIVMLDNIVLADEGCCSTAVKACCPPVLYSLHQNTHRRSIM